MSESVPEIVFPTDRPFRWYRLWHTVLDYQILASPRLADVTDMKWRLARGGLHTTEIRHEWLDLRPESLPPVPLPKKRRPRLRVVRPRKGRT